MPSLPIRPAEPRDIPAITRIYAHAVTYGTASFELDAPDEAEIRRRYITLRDGGFPFIVAEIGGEVAGYASQGGDVAERAAITGALSLYLNFINLFTLLLQLLGQRD